jgi:hypothetical protein
MIVSCVLVHGILPKSGQLYIIRGIFHRAISFSGYARGVQEEDPDDEAEKRREEQIWMSGHCAITLVMGFMATFFLSRLYDRHQTAASVWASVFLAEMAKSERSLSSCASFSPARGAVSNGVLQLCPRPPH